MTSLSCAADTRLHFSDLGSSSPPTLFTSEALAPASPSQPTDTCDTLSTAQRLVRSLDTDRDGFETAGNASDTDTDRLDTEWDGLYTDRDGLNTIMNGLDTDEDWLGHRQ